MLINFIIKIEREQFWNFNIKIKRFKIKKFIPIKNNNYK